MYRYIFINNTYLLDTIKELGIVRNGPFFKNKVINEGRKQIQYCKMWKMFRVKKRKAC